jgi:hypothetical protein
VITTLTAWPPWRRRLLVAMSQPPHTGDESQQKAAVDVRVTFDGRVGLLGRRGTDSAEPGA